MRQILWGALCGALLVYAYTYYGHQLTHAKHQLDTWRDHAITASDGYAAGRKK